MIIELKGFRKYLELVLEIKDLEITLIRGESGAGKTTVTKLSKPRFILGDDSVILQNINGSSFVYTSPFNSETNGYTLHNSKSPIAGCFRLVQDKTTFVEKTNKRKMVTELLANIPSLNNNSEIGNDLFECCIQLVDRVPCYELHFTKDISFWRTIHEIL